MFGVRNAFREVAKSVRMMQQENDQLKAENAKLREYAKLMHGHIKECCDACGERGICDVDALTRELEVDE